MQIHHIVVKKQSWPLLQIHETSSNNQFEIDEQIHQQIIQTKRRTTQQTFETNRDMVRPRVAEGTLAFALGVPFWPQWGPHTQQEWEMGIPTRRWAEGPSICFATFTYYIFGFGLVCFVFVIN